MFQAEPHDPVAQEDPVAPEVVPDVDPEADPELAGAGATEPTKPPANLRAIVTATFAKPIE